MSATHSTAHRQHYAPPPAQPAARNSESHSADHSFHARAALAAVYILAATTLLAILTGAFQP